MMEKYCFQKKKKEKSRNNNRLLLRNFTDRDKTMNAVLILSGFWYRCATDL